MLVTTRKVTCSHTRPYRLSIVCAAHGRWQFVLTARHGDTVSYRGVSFSSSRVDLLETRKCRTTQCGENYDEPGGPLPKNEEAEVDKPQGHIGGGMDRTRPHRVI